MQDVLQARDAGVSAVLVGSALHDGRIDREALRVLGDDDDQGISSISAD